MNLTTLRKHIAALTAEKSAIVASGRSRGEVHAGIDAFCRTAAAAGEQRLAHAITSDDLTQAFVIRDPGPNLFPNVAPLLAALLGADRLCEALCNGLDDIVPAGMPAADRAERLAEISAELDKLERDEERLIVASEETAAPIARRADARPEIVLELLPAVSA